jgi:hypothetical protein
MKTLWLQRLLVAAGFVAALLLTGCYTQLEVTESERSEDGSYASAYGDTTVYDSTAAREYDYSRRQMYFDYYYPSFVFSVGYYSPWYWGPSWWYTPYWTPYWYGNAWYAPVYDPGWYYPYYGYPYPGYPYPGGGSAVPYATRSFGNTRTVGATRGMAGSVSHGGGSMIDAGGTGYRSGGASTGARATPGVRVPTVPRTLAPTPSPRVSPGQRSPGGERYNPPRSSGGNTPGREYTPERRSGSSGNGAGVRSEPRTQSAPDRGTRDGGGRSGGGSYSPPSAPSSPPPSSGGGGGGGGQRGGGNRR